MILKASERGHAAELARHLMNAQDNEHVELHELRGFVSDDLHGALQESHAIARGTRCKNFLFSLSLSPPEDEPVPADVFEAAIEQIEQKLGLADQPRAIVFHEKEGRHHAHAVWSRIDGAEMKAINLSHYKRKLNGIARDLYLEHGWDMPDGFRKDRLRDALTFSLAEWQQAKRAGRDPKALKALVQAAWKRSDTKAALNSALREAGLFLARGDRRGVVLVDLKGEIYSLSRLSGAKAKELTARLGDPSDLPSVEQQKAWLAAKMTERLRSHLKQLEERHRKKGATLEFQRAQMVARHRTVRADLKTAHSVRWQQEELKRASKLPRGLKGLWSWITGDLKKIRHQNALDIARAERRDGSERHSLITKQLAERRRLQKLISARRERQEKDISDLHRDIVAYLTLGQSPEPNKQRGRRLGNRTKDRRLGRTIDRDVGPARPDLDR